MDELFPAARQAHIIAALDKLARNEDTFGRDPDRNRDAALARDLLRLNDQLLVGLDHWPSARDFVSAVLAREGLAGAPA